MKMRKVRSTGKAKQWSDIKTITDNIVADGVPYATERDMNDRGKPHDGVYSLIKRDRTAK